MAAKKRKTKVPSEALESQRLIDYLRMRGLKYSHIPGESSSRTQRIKNARAGYVPGLPDFLILLPTVTLWIEMKKQKGGRVSEQQRAWIDALNAQAGQFAAVCNGFEEARDVVEGFK